MDWGWSISLYNFSIKTDGLILSYLTGSSICDLVFSVYLEKLVTSMPLETIFDPLMKSPNTNNVPLKKLENLIHWSPTFNEYS